MTASIVIDDGVNPPAIGTVERDASFLATLFTLSNFDDTGVAAWRWTILDQPIGSSATLSSGITATTQIAPDVAGAILVRLQTYTDAGATILDDQDEQLIGIAFPLPDDYQIPAAGETVQRGPRGWATPVEYILREIRAELPSGVRDHLVAGEVGVVKANYEYLVHSLTVDAGATFTIEAGSSGLITV